LYSGKVDHLFSKRYNGKMPVIDYNLGWMLYNIYLALLALVFGYFALVIRWKWLKIVFGVLWFLYLPNTIYIFTDLEHLIQQWHKIVSSSFLLILQYLIFELIGIIVFILALVPFEKAVHASKRYKNKFTIYMILFNFLIAFGMVLGRVERVNSWEIFTAPGKVINAALDIITSLELIGLTVLFGLLCNFVYFLFRDPTHKVFRKILYVLD